MDVVVVVADITSAGVITHGPGLGLCVAVLKVAPSFQSVGSPCMVFTPG